jgi:hypothetical protein
MGRMGGGEEGGVRQWAPTFKNTKGTATVRPLAEKSLPYYDAHSRPVPVRGWVATACRGSLLIVGEVPPYAPTIATRAVPTARSAIAADAYVVQAHQHSIFGGLCTEHVQKECTSVGCTGSDGRQTPSLWPRSWKKGSTRAQSCEGGLDGDATHSLTSTVTREAAVGDPQDGVRQGCIEATNADVHGTPLTNGSCVVSGNNLAEGAGDIDGGRSPMAPGTDVQTTSTDSA